MRQRIEVTAIRGNVAMLSNGPPAGTQVVSATISSVEFPSAGTRWTHSAMLSSSL